MKSSEFVDLINDNRVTIYIRTKIHSSEGGVMEAHIKVDREAFALTFSSDIIRNLDNVIGYAYYPETKTLYLI